MCIGGGVGFAVASDEEIRCCSVSERTNAEEKESRNYDWGRMTFSLTLLMISFETNRRLHRFVC